MPVCAAARAGQRDGDLVDDGSMDRQGHVPHAPHQHVAGVEVRVLAAPGAGGQHHLVEVAVDRGHRCAHAGRTFGELAEHRRAGQPVGFWWGLVLMLGFAYLLAVTPLGRNMRFVGANREVSRLAGVRVNRIRFGAFVSAGVIAGVGGVLAAAAVGGFDPTTSQSYLLPMFAATFLGTAILQPGRFNPLGTLLAVYFLATGILGLNLLGYTGWVTSVFYGGVLVVAVTISSLLHRRAG